MLEKADSNCIICISRVDEKGSSRSHALRLSSYSWFKATIGVFQGRVNDASSEVFTSKEKCL